VLHNEVLVWSVVVMVDVCRVAQGSVSVVCSCDGGCV